MIYISTRWDKVWFLKSNLTAEVVTPLQQREGVKSRVCSHPKSKFGRTWEFTAGSQLSLCLLIPWPARGTGPESESICLLRDISRETKIIYLAAWLMEVCRDQYRTWNCLSAHLCLTSTKIQRNQYKIHNYLSIHSLAYLLSQLWYRKQTSRNMKYISGWVSLLLSGVKCYQLSEWQCEAFKIYSRIAKIYWFNDVQNYYALKKGTTWAHFNCLEYSCIYIRPLHLVPFPHVPPCTEGVVRKGYGV